MIQREAFDALRARALTFPYTSFTYLEYERAARFEPLEDSEGRILLFGERPEAGVHELHWAARDPDGLIEAARLSGGETLVTFVPEAWKERFLAGGFTEFGILREYWIRGLREAYAPRIACAPIAPEECAEAALVTQSCRLQSREFYGETAENLMAWMTGQDPDAKAGGARHETALACREGGRIAGVICTAVYGYDGRRGPIAWIREVSVLPDCQGRGYGRALVESALQYGLERGAKNAFLLADDCNAHAIALYRKIGFEPNMDEAQIDLVYHP